MRYVSDENLKSKVINIKTTEEEKKQIDKHAAENGYTTSEYIRSLIRKDMKK